MEILFPRKGVSDLLAPGRQMAGTTTRAANVRLLDPWSGNLCGSQRSGLAPFSGDVVGAGTKIKRLVDLVYDARIITYTALGDSVTQDWSSSSPLVNDVLALVWDKLGNAYYLDGASVVKINPEGAIQWKIALPAVEPASILRALAVDNEFHVFVGVSAGPDPKKAKLWGYEQLEDNKTNLVWTLTPGYFTEALKWTTSGLYAAQNDTLNWKSRVALYTGLDVPNPTLTKSWDAYAYPINDLDVSDFDGSVALAHEPFNTRGNDPRSPETTGPLDDMTLEQILGSNFKQRLWSWHSSMDVDGDDTNNSAYDDGDTVDIWIDKSGNDRNWYTRDPDLGPILRKNAIAGRDSLFWNGTDCSMISERGISTLFAHRQLNRTTLPLYQRHQFAVIYVIRTPLDTTTRVLEAITPAASTGAYDKERILYTNTVMNAAATLVNAPGNMMLYEETLNATNPAHGNAGAVGSTTPLPGAFDSDGLMVVTWICDHGYDDQIAQPTRSTLRINGRPVDRWESVTGFETLEAPVLGLTVYPGGATPSARFEGDILERIVLCDSYDTSFGQTTAFAQRRLVSTPDYPTGVWGAGSNTELEQIEGFAAHRRGIAHKLPTGNAAILDALAVGNVNDTITIAGHVYTLKAAPTTVADEVRIGGTAFATLQNLMHAINGTGTPGTDYGSATVRHSTIWSPGVVINGNTANRPDLFVQRRDPRISSTFAVAESTAGARFNWITGANSVTSRAGAGRNCGHYPHPFYLVKTAQSPGGPPRTVGVGQDSLYSGLISPYGIVSLWDPATGRLKDILTTGGPRNSGLPYGGLGYGVRFNSAGDLYVCGPRQALDAALGTVAENIDLRKLVQSTTGFIVIDGSTALSSWTAAPGAFTYHYPRMAVDKWDNVHVPLSVAGKSMGVYRRIAPSNALDSALIYTVSNITDDPSGTCVALNPKEIPDYPSGFTLPRAERVILGTLKPTGSNFVTLYSLREVTAANTGTSPRTIEYLAVQGTSLFKIVPGGSEVLIDAAAFETGARFIDSASHKGVRFFTDGTHYYVYDPHNGTAGRWRARSGGQIPPRAMFLERFGARIIVAGLADRRSGLAMCKYDDPYNWDFDPQGDSPLTVAAISSELSNLGDFPDIITCVSSFRDDLCLVGGDKSIALMRGDPAQGGKFDELVKGIGVAFGRARCWTPDGTFWWITQQAEFYRMRLGENPERLSDHVQRRLSNSLDFSTARPELYYDPNERSIRILQCVNGNPSALYTHWTYELDTGDLVGPMWPDTYGTKEVQPATGCLVDGDSANDRKFVVGCGDGWIRAFTRTAQTDDGVRIASEAFCHMPFDNKAPMQALFTELEIVMALDQYDAQYEFYATQDAKDFGAARVAGFLKPGRNMLSRVRRAGRYCGVLIKGSEVGQKWALGTISVNAEATADVRS